MCIKALCFSSNMHLLVLSVVYAWLTSLCRKVGKVIVRSTVTIWFLQSKNKVQLLQPRVSAEEQLFCVSHLVAMGSVRQLESSRGKKIPEYVVKK